MEKQLTIFDVFSEMDAKKENVSSLYTDCAADDYHFEVNDKKAKYFMTVVCNLSDVKLLLVSINLNDKGMINFEYSAVDNYWQGSYVTPDISDVKKSIRNLVDDIRKDLNIKKAT